MGKEEVIKQKFPTEVIDLPSKGLIYPKDNPLASGTIELKYMTAKEEDILTSQNLIQKGIVIDKLLESLIVSEIDYNDLYIGDKNAIMMAARILGYGANYDVGITCPHCGEKTEVSIDLQKLPEKEFDESLFSNSNEFIYELPFSKRMLTFKLLTHRDEKKIEEELRFIKKISREDAKADFTTRMKYMILAVDGDREQKTVRNFVENDFLSKDSLEFRKHIKEMSPDIDMSYPFTCDSCGRTTTTSVPMTVQFFWPNAGV